MIPNCKGCQENHGFACQLVAEGFNIATMKDREFIDKHHLHIIIVNNKGNLIAW